MIKVLYIIPDIAGIKDQIGLLPAVPSIGDKVEFSGVEFIAKELIFIDRSERVSIIMENTNG